MSPTPEERNDFLANLNIVLEAKPKTYIFFKWSHHHEESGGGTGVFGPGGGSFGTGVHVGDLVNGGVVTNVTESTIAIRFPDGPPEGPINLPGVDTTVIFERSGAATEESSSTISPGMAPWGEPDEVFGSPGGENPEIIPEIGELHKRYKLPCPGGKTSHARISDLIIFNPTNISDCSCATIFLASLGADGRIMRGADGQALGAVMLDPGRSVPEFHALPGAVGIVAVCNGGCTGCTAELRISNPIS